MEKRRAADLNGGDKSRSPAKKTKLAVSVVRSEEKTPPPLNSTSEVLAFPS